MLNTLGGLLSGGPPFFRPQGGVAFFLACCSSITVPMHPSDPGPHIGFGVLHEGDPTPEERKALDAEFMATPNRALMLTLMDRKRRGEDSGELEEFRAREHQRQQREVEELGAVLSYVPPDCKIQRPLRHSRPRARRAIGCVRRRGSRRSTGTGSRAGPDDDPGESDPDDHHRPPVVGESAGAVQ